MSLITAIDGTITLSKARKLVCFEAAAEVEILARTLPSLVPSEDGLIDAHYVVRGISSRLVELAKVLITAVVDDLETTERLKARITHMGE